MGLRVPFFFSFSFAKPNLVLQKAGRVKWNATLNSGSSDIENMQKRDKKTGKPAAI